VNQLAKKTATVTAIAGLALAATAAEASAATPLRTGATSKAKASPDMCPSGGPYIDVATNGGKYYVSHDTVHSDTNGTSYTASDTFSNTWSGTQSTTVSASFSFSASDLVSTVKADLGISAETSTTISGSHSITFTIAPHSTLYAQYGTQMQNIDITSYDMSGSCSAYDYQYGTGSVVLGQGWNSWT
jgi:hypothetical protein